MNRNFISTLTHAATECSQLSPSSNSPNPNNQAQNSPNSTNSTSIPITSVLSSASTTNTGQIDLNASLDLSSNPKNMRLLNPLSLSIPLNNTTSASQNSPTIPLSTDLNSPQQVNPPSNLLVIFLQSCSAILQETKMETHNTYDTVKLFMLILICISEDQYANSLLHDSNLLYSVFLYQAVNFKFLEKNILTYVKLSLNCKNV